MKRPAPARRRLIWSADDFGYSGTVNEGIALAHRQGLVRGASLLAGGEAFEGAVRLARALPDLDLGVHLAAVGVRAVLPPARLGGLASEDGRLPRGYAQFLPRFALGLIRADSVMLEWEAQLARILDAGLRPIYADSHQHLHVLPGLLERALPLLKRFGIRALRAPCDAAPGRASLPRALVLGALFQLGRGARQRARAEGFFTPDGTVGIADAGRLDAARIGFLARSLLALPPGTFELVAHPGLGEPQGSEASGWNYRWADELAAARDPELAALLREAGIEVLGYRDCLGGTQP